MDGLLSGQSVVSRYWRGRHTERHAGEESGRRGSGWDRTSEGWASQWVRRFSASQRNEHRRLDGHGRDDGRRHHLEAESRQALRRYVELQRVADVVFDVAPLDVGLARIGTRRMIVTMGVVIGPMAEMSMVQVKPTHLVVVVCRSMHVRSAGHEAEREIDGATTYGEEPTHPAKSSPTHD